MSFHATHWPATWGAAPAGTGEQVPFEPGRSQAWQVPEQATLQQTPLAQNPLPQSALHPQVSPAPMLPGTAPSRQTILTAASLTAASVDPDPLLLHPAGSQSIPRPRPTPNTTSKIRLRAPMRLRCIISCPPLSEQTRTPRPEAQLLEAGRSCNSISGDRSLQDRRRGH